MTPETTPVEQLHVVLSLADSILVIDTAACMIEEMAAMVEGTVASHQFELFDASLVMTLRGLGSLTSSGWFARDSLEVEVRGEHVDISVFQPFLIGVDSLEGTLSTNMRVTGSTEVPVITGAVTVSDLSLNAPEYFTSIRGGYAGLSFDKQKVNIDSLWMAVNGGTVSMAGKVSHELGEITDIDLHLQANDVLFQEADLYYATVREATLNYSRQENLYVLDGDVQLGDTRLTARFRPQSILPWVSAAETVEWELPELIARSRLDVRLKESGELWVDNNLARIRMLATVGIVGTPVRPNLNGQITIEEGYLLYLDRRFKVNEGTVYFSDPLKFNPDVLLDASTQVTSYRRTTPVTYGVFIRAEGLLDQLQVALYSEPPLDKPDIVALLTLGATRTDLAGKSSSEGSGGLKNVLADRAAMLGSRRISNYVSTKAGSAFGFDEFTIQGNLFQFDQSWGPQLVASRKLSERVDMTYTTRVGHLNDQSIQLGYRLTPKLSIQSETDSFGRAGFDLKYGFKFR
jgi:autotransporter translocation and assembly factor TamB